MLLPDVKHAARRMPDQHALPNGAGLQFLFLDACFDDEDEEEDAAFQRSMDTLFEMLMKAPKLHTFDVNEKVNSEHGKLKKRIEESEKLGEMLREFKSSVQKQRFIGLVNQTDADITFTSKRVLMERHQVRLFQALMEIIVFLRGGECKE